MLTQFGLICCKDIKKLQLTGQGYDFKLNIKLAIP